MFSHFQLWLETASYLERIVPLKCTVCWQHCVRKSENGRVPQAISSIQFSVFLPKWLRPCVTNTKLGRIWRFLYRLKSVLYKQLEWRTVVCDVGCLPKVGEWMVYMCVSMYRVWSFARWVRLQERMQYHRRRVCKRTPRIFGGPQGHEFIIKFSVEMTAVPLTAGTGLDSRPRQAKEVKIVVHSSLVST